MDHASATLPGARQFALRETAPGSRLALCLWIPTFELRLELVRTPELDSTSVALLAPGEGTRQEIWQVSERAGLAGVRPGMTVSKAVGLCSALTILEPDPEHYDAATEEMLEALGELSPVVEPAGRGRVFVGMDGLGRLFGSPRRQVGRALRTLLGVFPRHLVAATRAGWAPGKFGAWVAAVSARPGKPVVVEEDALVEFLKRCPVQALPVAPLVLERLQRLDLSTLEQLARIPEPALVGQFGQDGSRALAWATGRRIDRVRPWFRARPIRVAFDFPQPVGLSGTLHGALHHLLDKALRKPRRQGRSVLGMRAGARLEGGGSWNVDAVLREPTADLEHLAFRLRSKLDLAPPPKAVETLMVELYDFGSAATQSDLFSRRQETARCVDGSDLNTGEIPDGLKDAIRELKLKIGYSPLFRVVEIDPFSRIPERRHALMVFDP